MYKITFTIFFALVVSFAFGQSAPGDKILGEWVNEEKDTRIEIYKNGNSYSGKLIWAQKLMEADGQTQRKDVNNTNEKLRTRSVLNIDLLHDFIYSEGIWDEGKMYDPKSGKTYSCLMKLRTEKLEIRGYVGIPLLGRSTYWERVL
ncbi:MULTISPECIES: DUF2147 domain-containing protein [Dyadobacter]|jgi:uncharacterized protein (DUF2147 family)|uniref:DUF2147 domain-containing protein n=1 Tax=Dyadobacter chenhuakuii TaxID=2909339 RepID=A0A9X1QB90_9BACT|nr:MULTISPECIES: DUF2147 domain-containing protein [Dyadobacter]MCE7072765.1 DUF2147 domain-containing protein [Dyadobacter sp. CY327]MCF2497821.1 DUF2147 domain-containing protein [Dyadobacter chenhuakuii]MCF2517326.1 DUF2147 domain-containing protein [Dyadobacter sp. CY351]